MIITTAQAGAALGIHRSRIQALIKSGRLPATRHGKCYIIKEADLERVRVRVNGRPRKELVK